MNKDRAKELAKVKARPKPTETVQLSAQELLATLPEMKKEERKNLKKALEEEEKLEALQALERHRILLDQAGDGGHEGSYSRVSMSGVASSSSETLQQMPIYPTAKKFSLAPPSAKDKPRGVHDREPADFRQNLIDLRMKDGRLIPSSAAPTPTEHQAKCPHPVDQLRWTANGEGHQARCKRCDLKNVLYFSIRHGVLVVSHEDVARMDHEAPRGLDSRARVWLRHDMSAHRFKGVNNGGPLPNQVCRRITKDVKGFVLDDITITNDTDWQGLVPGGPREIITEFWYLPQTATVISTFHADDAHMSNLPSLAIADSGCRNAVGGRTWHENLQEFLMEKNIPFEEVSEHEVYRFGAGEPVVSEKAFLYPVGIHGSPDIIRMSMVDGDARACPGLIGPSELSRWGAVFKFQGKQMELQGVSKPMRLTSTRHPGIDLLDVDFQHLISFWDTSEAAEKKKLLTMAPQSLSFIAGGFEENEGVEEASSESVAEDDDEATDYEERRKVEVWRNHLEEDLGILTIPTVQTGQDDTEVSSLSDDPPSVDTESSSHEVGVELVSEESSDDDEAEREARNRNTYVASTAKKKVINKSLRRKLGHQASEIKKSFGEEVVRKKDSRLKEVATTWRPPRRPKPWSVLEVFTWTCAISIAASARGWIADEPITLPGWDLLKDNDYEAALDYIDRVQPDLLVLAFPCTVWSQLQELGRQTPLRRHRLLQKRLQQRKLLRFVRDAAFRQRQRGGALMGENPFTSRAWKEPLIIEAFDNQEEGMTDMCQFGLKVPGKGLLRKRTRLRGSKAVIKHACKRCPGRHHHTPVLGGAKINGQWINISDFAGGYTKAFADAVLDGAEEHLRGGLQPEVFVEGGTVEEERFHEFQAEDEVTEAEDERDKRPGKGSTHWKIQLLHQRLGHPTNATLAKMLSLSGAAQEVVKAAQSFECPTCQEVAAPGRYMKQRPDLRPTVFGTEIHCDLKYLHDCNNKLYVALSVVDGATSFHMCVLLRSRSAHHVARKLARHWCSIHGIPEVIVLDQGGEFDGEFVGWLETHGIHSKTTGAKSPWQHGFAERHGALIGTMCSSLIWQYKARGPSEVKDCLASAVYAKNSTITKKGYTPFQLAFGRSPMFPDLLEEDSHGNLALRQALGTEGEVARTAEMRAAAKAVLLRQDTQEKIKRALRRWPRGEQREFEPGEMVYFYSPKPQASRFKKDGGAWRGPAVVVMKESHQRYFLSWRSRCILVSAPNIRPASQDEVADPTLRTRELQQAEEGWQEEKEYVDLSGEKISQAEVEAEEEEHSPGWDAQEGVIIRKKRGRPKNQAKEIAKALKGTKTVIKKGLKTKQRPKKQDLQELKKTREEKKREEGVTEAEIEELKDEKVEIDEKLFNSEDPAKDVQVREGEIWKLLEEAKKKDEESFPSRLRQHLLDDLPVAFKQKRSVELPLDEEQVRKRFKPSIFNYTMVSTMDSSKRSNEWVSRKEVKKLSNLLDLPIVSARFHLEPRKKFQKPLGSHARSRITVMLNEEIGSAMVCQEGKEEVGCHPRRKCSHLWKGLTLFLRDEVQKERMVYVEFPSGIYAVKVEDYEKWEELRAQEEDDRSFFEAFILQNKANGKELDPRYFDETERLAFQEADKKEWFSWIKNRVVRRLSDQEAAKVDRRLIFKAPARMVRVNKGAMEGVLRAKSRLVIPGHLDPHLGSYRADAPTTMWTAVQLAKTIAATRKWEASCFDVTTAFLSGKEVSREVYIRPPPEGLPACEEAGEEAVSPEELLKVCKSAYGLSEAPRLWYLRASEILTEIGYQELSMCRATFIYKEKDEVVSILCLHVDDGLVVASKKVMEAMKKSISAKFSIKEWQDLSEKPVTFLGVKTRYVNHVFYDDMTDYVMKIDAASITGAMEEKLDGAALSAYRRLVMQLRWPAHLVMPEFLFSTSDLAQRVTKSTFSDLKHANGILKQMKEAAKKGQASLTIQSFKGPPLFVTYFDASLGKSALARAQQGEVHFITSSQALHCDSTANMIEFHSNRVPRVVRSSLAAEGASMASAGDRQLFNRVLFDALFHGRAEISSSWRRELQTDGVLITDAKGLHDHVHKTGGVATEKQAALDILLIKQLVEDQVLGLRWTPTWKQLADPLTKEMPGVLLESFRSKPVLCLVQTDEDVVEEARRASLRKAQRERRKARMKNI